MTRTALAAAALALAATAATAAPDCGAEGAVFHCAFESGHEVTVCERAGETFSYAYGKPGQSAELELLRDKGELTYRPWPGIGRTIWSALAFANGEYRYEVWWGVDKQRSVDEADYKPEGQLSVFKGPGETPIAEKTCLPGTVTSALWDLEGRF